MDKGPNPDRGLIRNSPGDASDDQGPAETSREEYYRLILQSTPEPILCVDRDHRLEFYNGRCEEWFGVDSRDFQGRHACELLGQANRWPVQTGIDEPCITHG